MKISYLGHSCFVITTKSGIKIVTDPYQGVGYSMPQNVSADIVTVSHGHFDHNYVDGVFHKIVLRKVDRYEQEGVAIYGISSYHDEVKGAKRGENIIFKMQIDGLTLCHMGDIGEPCSPELLQKIGKVDVLLIPIGGTYTVDYRGALEYIREIAPKAVIPMHYRPADGSLDVAPIEGFLSLVQGEITEVQSGVLTLDCGEEGIFYMQRVKQYDGYQ